MSEARGGVSQASGMGIRYYAYPLLADEVERARNDPRAYLSDDPLADAWGMVDRRPKLLYLDKCWSPLQRVFHPDPDRHPRPSFTLVEGNVTHTGYGWIPYIKVLSPDVVSDIARDIVLTDANDVRTALGLDMPELQPPSLIAEFDYVMEYLAAAREFVADLDAEGCGLIYLIG